MHKKGQAHSCVESWQEGNVIQDRKQRPLNGVQGRSAPGLLNWLAQPQEDF